MSNEIKDNNAEQVAFQSLFGGEDFHYAGHVGAMVDALTYSKSGAGTKLFLSYSEALQAKKNKKGLTVKEALMDDTSEFDTTTVFYDMFNVNDYEPIAEYWLSNWSTKYAVTDFMTIAGEPNVGMGGHYVDDYWHFVALDWYPWAVDYQGGNILSKTSQQKGLVLDHIAWYYPDLAAVVAEMFYKIYNIALQTPCIYVEEIAGPQNGVPEFVATMRIKNMPVGHWGKGQHPWGNGAFVQPYKTEYMTINKKAIADDLIKRKFIF